MQQNEILSNNLEVTATSGTPPTARVRYGAVANAAPVVTTSAGKLTYNEQEPTGAYGAKLDPNITVTDDGATLASATVAIVGSLPNEDILNFSNYDPNLFGNISGSYNFSTGIMSLTSAGATATVAQWQAALRTVSYTNVNSANPLAGDHVINITVNDGLLNSETASKAVSVVAVNDAPEMGTGNGRAFVTGLSIPGGAILQSDGKAVLAGFTQNNVENFSLIRFTAKGTIDVTFGNGGTVMTQFGTTRARGNDVAQQSDGKLVVAGEVGELNSTNFGVARYNSDGTLDTSFDGDGKLTTDFAGGNDIAYAVVVQADGKIVVGGNVNSTGSSDFGLARYNTNGSLDTAFDGDGKVTTDLGGDDRLLALLQQSDGKLLAVGGNYGAVTLVRYNSNGSIDTTFDGDGKLSVSNMYVINQQQGTPAALQSDGKILVTGTSAEYSDGGRTTYLTVIRYNSDGSLDTTFGTSGIFKTIVGAKSSTATAVAVQADGKIVVTGTDATPGNSDVALVRLNSNGTLDSSFSNDGKLTAPLGEAYDNAYAVQVQADGKLLVASPRALLHFNADGSLDTDYSGTLYTLGGAPVALDRDAHAADPELARTNNYQGNFAGASLLVQRVGGANAQDVFSALGGGQLGALTHGASLVIYGTTIGSVSNTGGALSLTFNSNATQYLVDQVLQRIAYSNPSASSPGTVQIAWTFNDGNSGAQGPEAALSGSTVTTVKLAANVAPVLAATAGATAAVEQALLNPVAVAVDPGLQLSDEGATLASATVAITNNFQQYADQLRMDYTMGDRGNITGSFNYNTGVMTLTSAGASATLAQWQNALRSVGYVTTSDTPSTAPRTVSFTINDGQANSNTVTKTVTVAPSNDAPALLGGDGIASTSMLAAADALAVQADGKILASGNSDNLYLVRYLASGKIDTSFGSAGIAAMKADAGNLWNSKLAVQANGKIIVAATSSTGDIALGRFNADGSADTTFDGDGTLQYDVSGASDELTKVLVQGDGKILTGSFANIGGNNRFTVTRFNANGSLDTTFGVNGKSVNDFGGTWSDAYKMALQPDGKIVMTTSLYSNYSLVRFNTDGTLDSSFDADGIVNGSDTNVAYSTNIRDVAVQADGKIVIAGGAWNGTQWTLGLLRYNSNGGIDTSFGINGKATLAVGSEATALNLQVRADGKLVVSGYSGDQYDHNYVVARFNSNGSVDTSFSGDGSVTKDMGSHYDQPNAMALQPDGAILLNGGYMMYGLDAVRFTSSGDLDTSFGQVTYTAGGAPVAIEPQAQVQDVEVNAGANGAYAFTGATLSISRHGGANAQDQFSAVQGGTLGALTNGGPLTVNGVNIGTVNLASGALTITFNSNAAPYFVNLAMGQLAYSNSSGTPPSSVQLDWTFNDGNTSGLQGSGGILSGAMTTTIRIGTGSAPAIAANRDFNGDGKSDIVLHNSSTGQLYLYQMNGTAISGQNAITTLTSGWKVVGEGDANGDGKSDLLLRNSSTGQLYSFLLNGATIIGQGTVDTLSGWTVAANADFNGDGKADIVLRNSTSGALYTYLMNGTAIIGQGLIDTLSAWTVVASGDYNGDHKADLLLRNSTTGQLYTYLMNGSAVIGQGLVDTLPSWQVAASGDYNGDGKADILLRNSNNGAIYEYLMNGSTVIGQGLVDTLADNWKIADGVGDFNGDGKSDILLRNSSTGQLYEYQMNGASIIGQGQVNTLPTTWNVADAPATVTAVAKVANDFNGDGKSDILLRNPATGGLYSYMMNGATISSQGMVDTLPGWVVAGNGDYNGDGKTDILLRNSGTGQLYEYLMNGASIIGQGLVDTLPAWTVAGSGDYNGDGKSDILLRNSSTGQLYEYQMNGTNIIGQGTIDTLPLSWQVAGNGDFNGDGKTDILLRNTASGQLYEYMLNGSAIIGQGLVDTLPGWQVAGTGDYNGDGKADILLRNSSSGQLYEYRMNGASIIGQGLVDTLPVSWQVANGNSDFNGDGKADLLLRNTGTGQLYEYLMNGSAIIGQGLVDTLPAWGVAMERKVFAFDSTALQSISGFTSTFDQLVLRRTAFSALSTGPLASGNFVSESGAVAHDANDYLLYDTASGKLYYDADGSGATAAVQIATLVGKPALAAGDVSVL